MARFRRESVRCAEWRSTNSSSTQASPIRHTGNSLSTDAHPLRRSLRAQPAGGRPRIHYSGVEQPAREARSDPVLSSCFSCHARPWSINRPAVDARITPPPAIISLFTPIITSCFMKRLLRSTLRSFFRLFVSPRRFFFFNSSAKFRGESSFARFWVHLPPGGWDQQPLHQS